MTFPTRAFLPSVPKLSIRQNQTTPNIKERLLRRRLSLACMPFLLAALAGCQGAQDSGRTTVRRAERASVAPAYTEPASNLPHRASSINDAARMLGGLEPYGSSDTFNQLQSAGWNYHRQHMDALWGTHERGRGSSIRQWAMTEIADLRGSTAVFYPFSGPDFLFANDLFPAAQTYILCGLEPAEPLPQLAAMDINEVAYGLSGLRTALSSIMQAGYFVTKDMRSDLQATRFRGVLPVMLALMARTGHTVDAVDPVAVGSNGNAVMVGASDGSVPGLLIRFRSPSGQAKRLYYFKQDLSNSGVKAGGPFLTFVAKQGYPTALVKSASYLMHQDSFSNIRNFLLRSTRAIVQDPSGVPYRDLVAAGHSIDLYGRYQGTLGIFNQQQPDLIAAFHNGRHRVQPVSFGFGYLFNPSSTCIIVARRR